MNAAHLSFLYIQTENKKLQYCQIINRKVTWINDRQYQGCFGLSEILTSFPTREKFQNFLSNPRHPCPIYFHITPFFTNIGILQAVISFFIIHNHHCFRTVVFSGSNSLYRDNNIFHLCGMIFQKPNYNNDHLIRQNEIH